MGPQRRQGVYWMLTIPADDWEPPEDLPEDITWLRGQQEEGQGGYRHWQILVAFKSKKSLRQCKGAFTESTHCELGRSEAAAEYVWKEDTRIAGTQFELGGKPLNRNSRKDWDSVFNLAKIGDMVSIPRDILVRCYHQLRSICRDFARPVAMERSCNVYWGPTGSGKSRRAWEEAGMDAYSKGMLITVCLLTVDPRTKWWDGYKGEDVCIIDEFRGVIDIVHLLRWLDRYPVSVEVKGGSVPLRVTKFWITSNVNPKNWYPEVDQATNDALMRRLNIELMDDFSYRNDF